MISLWPVLVVLVDAILVTIVSSTSEAGNIIVHWLLADTAYIHHSLGDSLKVKSLVQLDGLEVIQHISIFGSDFYWLIFDFFLFLCL